MLRFNPRAREGATRTCLTSLPRNNVSIHAPVRARRRLLVRHRVDYRFNPRAREGATQTSIVESLASNCFNPRAREGATRPLCRR